MKIIILAAGLGSRLDDSEQHLPKPLTRLINGKSILQLQIETLQHYTSLDNIFVVVGYQKEQIMEQFPDLIYIYNPAFAQENTSKSLLRALKKIDEDVLWLNGDVLFQPSILEQIFQKDHTCLVVNQTSVEEEEVKYRTDRNGKILEVSKRVQQPEGEALGINFFKKEDLSFLKQNLEHCQPNDYFEKGVESTIQNGVNVWALVIPIESCVEIDFPEDLVKANQMLQLWSKL